MEARCMRCKEQREMKDAKEVEMKGKGGRVMKAMTGCCVKCGCKMFKILPKK